MSDVTTYQNYIGGAFVASASGETRENHNPANNALLSHVPESNASDVQRAVEAARGAQKAWAARPAIERAGYLHAMADKIRDNVAHLATIIVAEQGKVRALAETERRGWTTTQGLEESWLEAFDAEAYAPGEPDEQRILPEIGS